MLTPRGLRLTRTGRRCDASRPRPWSQSKESGFTAGSEAGAKAVREIVVGGVSGGDDVYPGKYLIPADCGGTPAMAEIGRAAVRGGGRRV